METKNDYWKKKNLTSWCNEAEDSVAWSSSMTILKLLINIYLIYSFFHKKKQIKAEIKSTCKRKKQI